MHLPEELLQSLEGIQGFDREAFEKVHESSEQITSVRINPLKLSMEELIHNSQLTINSRVPWSAHGYYLDQRPSFTFDPLFHAGCYYVQEASSMFVEQCLRQTVDLSKPLKVLDIAAAPGGKSTHLQSLISKDSLLVSNEVIKSRTNVLKDNIVKWGGDNVIATNNDPKHFQRLQNYFDVIVVDAPCSGSGLFRRDAAAIREWSQNNVQLCSQRQQRILADVWPALKKNGVLIYSTCAYSKEEDEQIVEWLFKKVKTKNEKLKIENAWNIAETEAGYRFWPDKAKGEGFFIACARKLDGETEAQVKAKRKIDFISKKEMEIVRRWVKETNHEFVKVQDVVYAVPKGLLDDINILSSNLYVIYVGIMTGQIMRDKLVPAHALAVSNLVSDNVERLDLNYHQAIQYLQKRNLAGAQGSLGWKLVTYKNYPLGWINVLADRINNYYPKELRILKDI